MPQYNAADNFQTTLAAAATSTQTTLDLTSITGAPAYPYLLTLTPAGGSPPYASYEVVAVTSLSSGTTVNVTRGVEGTAQAWSSGDAASNGLTAGQFGLLMQANWPLDSSWMVVGALDADSVTYTAMSGSGTIGAKIPTLGGWINTGTTANSTADVVFGMYDPTPTTSAWDPSVGNGYGWVGQFYTGSPPAGAGDSITIVLADGYNIGGTGFQISYSGGLLTQLYNNGTLTTSAVQVTANAWHRFALIAKGTQTDVWIDGQLAGTIAAVPTRGNAWIVAGIFNQNGAAGDNVQTTWGPSFVLQSFT